VFWVWLFIAQLELGVEGAAYAMTITYFTNFLTGFLMLRFLVPDEVKPEYRLSVNKTLLKEMLGLGVPGMITLLAEWGFFES
jgi:Na+-driven multidrug efflux pump